MKDCSRYYAGIASSDLHSMPTYPSRWQPYHLGRHPTSIPQVTGIGNPCENQSAPRFSGLRDWLQNGPISSKLRTFVGGHEKPSFFLQL